jgi:hypothetical protein
MNAQAPARQSLIGLTPFGVGTARVESLESYAARLAHRHRTTCSAVLGFAMRIKHGSLRPDAPSSLALSVARALARETGCEDVARLGLGRFHHQLGRPRSVHDWIRWCPECLSEMAPDETYVPLVWLLARSTVCTMHGAALATVCGHCSQSINSMSSVLARTCPSCKGGLALRTDGQPREHAPLDLTVTHVVERFVRDSWPVDEDPSQGSALQRLMETVAGPNRSKLDELPDVTGMGKSEFERLRRAGGNTSFGRLACLCALAGVPLLGAVRSEHWQEHPPPSPHELLTDMQRPKRCSVEALKDVPTLRHQLSVWLSEGRGLPMVEIERRLNMNRNRIRNLAGSQILEWLARQAKWELRYSRSQEGIKARTERIADYLQRMHSATDGYPTYDRMKADLFDDYDFENLAVAYAQARVSLTG